MFTPLSLWLFIALIFIATIACIWLRLSLYGYIMNSANKVTRLLNNVTKRLEEDKELSAHRVQELINEQTENLKLPIVLTLKKRFEKASKNLEQVNTAALVDGIYSEEKFRFGKFRLTCEQWDYFCRFFPNILISFGLLGTFLGITINLSSVSGIINQNINQNNNNIDYLLNELGQPLEGMAIAFVSSLIAIACSVILTLVNLGWNTSLAKEKLISSLEDFLDNVLHPTIDGYTRLDKSVNRMVETQNQFLNRFHENVEIVLESTMGRVADRIAAQNEKSHQLAEQVYEGMKLSSTTLLQGAEEFKVTTGILQKSATTFQAASVTIKQSKFADRLLEASNKLETTQQYFSQSAFNLQRATASVEGAISLFQRSTDEMVQLGKQQVNSLERQSVQIKELSDNHQQNLKDISSKLEQGADNIAAFGLALQNFDSNNKQSLGEIKTQLQQGATNLEVFTTVVEQLNQNNQTSFSTIANKLEQEADNIAAFGLALQNFDSNNKQSLGEIKTQLQQGVENIAAFGFTLQDFDNNNQQSLNNLITKLEEGFKNIETFNKTVQQFNSYYENSFNLLTKNLEKLDTNITQLQDRVKEMVQTGEKQATSLNKQIEQLSQMSLNHQQSIREIATQLRVGAQNIEKFEQVVAQLNENNQQSLGEIKTQLEEGVEYMENLGISVERFKNNNQKLLRDIATKLEHSNDSYSNQE